jgi:hypothetical protein
VSARKKKEAMSDEELQKFLEDMSPPTWDEIQAVRKVLRSQTRQDALVQIVRAMPEGSESSGTAPSWQAGALLGTFLPNDGPESAIARLTIAAMNAAMDCFARANSDASEVRYLELNYAAKLSLVAAALGKAFDQHRESKDEDYIDDAVPLERRLKFRRKKPSGPAQDQASDEKPACSAEGKE